MPVSAQLGTGLPFRARGVAPGRVITAARIGIPWLAMRSAQGHSWITPGPRL